MRRTRSIILAVLTAALVVSCAAPPTGRADAAGSTDLRSQSEPSTTSAPVIETVGQSQANGGDLLTPDPDEPSTPLPSTPSSTGTPVRATSRPLPGCMADTLATRTPGTLTLATGDRTAPWFTGSDPADGQGFEAAIGTAVADRLGFDSAHVRWVTANRAAVLAGSTGGFDAFIGRVAIPDQPATKVQYSTGYLDDQTVLVAAEGSNAAAARSEADLSSLTLTVLSGSASAPTAGSAHRVDSIAELAAMAGSVDGSLIPLSSVTPVVDGTRLAVVARLAPAAGEQPHQFGMVLPASSTLASCVSTAIDTLRIEGTLTDLAQEWLPGAKAPELAAG